MKPRSYKNLRALAGGTLAMLALTFSAAAGAEVKKTSFTSIGVFQGDGQPIPGTGIMFTDGVKLYAVDVVFAAQEFATDPRLTGDELITGSLVFDLPVSPGPMWGKYHLENSGGAWDGYWTGARTAYYDAAGSHLLTRSLVTARGSGAYQGLIMRGEVTGLDLHLPGGVSETVGYIIEAKGGPGERPMQSRSKGTERVEVHPGLFLNPPIGGGVMVSWEILSEVAQVSHLGRAANRGFGVLSPLTGGEVSGSGVLTSANGDQLYWVATGWSLGPSGPVDLTLHWAGGTGRLEAAVGEVNGNLELLPTMDPAVMELDFEADGIIQY